jgi:hypothetical protein
VSEKTPWVALPISVGRGVRFSSAWVNVSPALIVRSLVSTATGPVKRRAPSYPGEVPPGAG